MSITYAQTTVVNKGINLYTVDTNSSSGSAAIQSSKKNLYKDSLASGCFITGNDSDSPAYKPVNICNGLCSFAKPNSIDIKNAGYANSDIDNWDSNKVNISNMILNPTGIQPEDEFLKDYLTPPQTTFLSRQCYTFSNNGDWWEQGFTIYQTTSFVLRFATQYAADAGVFADDQRSNFENNRTFSGWGGLDNLIGYHYFTFAPGHYYLGMRNQVSIENTASLELDFNISLPSSDNCTFYDFYVNGVENISSGGKLSQEFTIQNGFRYFLDGTNSGLEVYLIPGNEISNFLNNQTFLYYTAYAQNSCGEGPGFFEILLPVGTYYMVAYNASSAFQSINYIMERWRQNNNSIDNISDRNAIIIYPNPAIDHITIEKSSVMNSKHEMLSVYNVHGQILIQQALQQAKTDVDISKLEKGVYVIKCESSEGIAVKRFIKD